MDQGIAGMETDGSSSFRRQLQRQEEKWWLPVPRVPPGGLQEDIRKQLQHKRDCANQILKAAMAINSIVLTDMEVPESYLENLPKALFIVHCNSKPYKISYGFAWQMFVGGNCRLVWPIGSID